MGSCIKKEHLDILSLHKHTYLQHILFYYWVDSELMLLPAALCSLSRERHRVNMHKVKSFGMLWKIWPNSVTNWSTHLNRQLRATKTASSRVLSRVKKHSLCTIKED